MIRVGSFWFGSNRVPFQRSLLRCGSGILRDLEGGFGRLWISGGLQSKFWVAGRA